MSEWPSPKKVFLDADIVIRAGKPPGGPLLGRLKDLVDDGVITVLTTDLTCQEVAKKHAENDYDIIKGVGKPRFREIIEEVLGAALPKTTNSELKAKLAEDYSQSTKTMFKELSCKTLAIDAVKPSTVFSAYTAGKGFFTGEGKKHQFSDAFIFECIKSEASSEEPVIIVSGDGDFDKPVEAEAHISLVKSLPDLFELLGLQIAKSKTADFLESYQEELIKAFNEALDLWGILVVDIEDAEIEEMDVTEVELVELTDFGSMEDGDTILVVGSFLVRADASYTHPDWELALWDSEEGRWFRDADDIVSGKTEMSLDVEVSMSVTVDKEGEPKGIKDLRFRGSNPLYVNLSPYP